TILQNMLVLAVDTVDQRDVEKKAIISSNVTLAVTPEEASALRLAQQMGELALSLRSSDDTEKITIRTLKPDDLRNNRIKPDKSGSAEEDPDGSKGGAVVNKLPDVPALDPTTQPEPQPEPVVKRKKPWTLTVINGESQGRAQFIEEDGDFETFTHKTDPESPRSNKPAVAPEKSASPDKAVAPEKPSTPATPAPAPEKPKPTKRPVGS
ncbi:MAG TPA: RcpC/CpaB family pilus assembly protein, partial [Gemmataceae bacterium]|nr:RcpC/CpaB family pilus assembly protein [Gemmataceae bacterium]